MIRSLFAACLALLAALPLSARAAESMGWQLRNACALMPNVASGAAANPEEIAFAYECLGYFGALMDTQLYLKAHGSKPLFCYTDEASPYTAGTGFAAWVNERPEMLNSKAGFAALPYLAELYPCPTK
jgi:hypothetical protein